MSLLACPACQSTNVRSSVEVRRKIVGFGRNTHPFVATLLRECEDCGTSWVESAEMNAGSSFASEPAPETGLN
jgi:hypothetical protein